MVHCSFLQLLAASCHLAGKHGQYKGVEVGSVTPSQGEPRNMQMEKRRWRIFQDPQPLQRCRYVLQRGLQINPTSASLCQVATMTHLPVVLERPTSPTTTKTDHCRQQDLLCMLGATQTLFACCDRAGLGPDGAAEQQLLCCNPALGALRRNGPGKVCCSAALETGPDRTSERQLTPAARSARWVAS